MKSCFAIRIAEMAVGVVKYVVLQGVFCEIKEVILE